VFESDAACETFLGLLGKYKEKFGIAILSYCLMGTHPHVVVRATLGQRAFSEFWKRVNWKFARWYNARTGGRGTVVMERMRSPRIQDGRHQLTVMRYGDLNPVRAGVARTAGDWRWSSFRHFAFGEPNDLITDPPEYVSLGRTAPERRRLYLHLFADRAGGEFHARRPELVDAPFIGDPEWISARRVACGLSPPPD
jgi:putative transposase